MTRAASDIVERLGPERLARVLDDVLDQARLARLATACGLTYKGLRTRSQKRDRLVSDLVDKAAREDKARTTIVRTLKKETSADARAWGRLDDDERRRRLHDIDDLVGNRKLGLVLFLLASSQNGPGADGDLQRLDELRSAVPKDSAEDIGAVRRQVTRLKKRSTELTNKVKHLEQQLVRVREVEKRLKSDLLARKGELAEARMLNERLRREVDQRPAAATATSGPELEALSKAVRKLATEQRKLRHSVAKMAEPARPEPVAGSDPGTSRALDALREDVRAWRDERRREVKDLARRLDEVRENIRTARPGSAPDAAPSRRRGAAQRVGVFVDVQNVWYGARQLKGKLDFDALLQAAVRDRRLIQATAYVVESKEIDQSGFIAMLEQRAVTVRRKTLKVRADGSMKGDWDMEMALDILDAAPKLNVVVLVSGDGDFTSLVNRVKAIGPRVEVVAFPRTTAKSLVEAADRFQPLDRKFMIRTTEKPSAAASRGRAPRSAERKP